MRDIQRGLESDLGESRTTISRQEETLRDQSERISHLAASVTTSNRAKNHFLGLMSHELRTPLSVILGFGSILQDGLAGPVNDEQTQYLERVLANGRHLNQLVDDMLFFVDAENDPDHAVVVAGRPRRPAARDRHRDPGAREAGRTGAGDRGRARGRAGAKRRGAAAPRALPFARQRLQVHRARRGPRRGGAERRRRRRRGRDHRYRPRDPARSARPHLRALSAGRRRPHAQARRRGARPEPGERLRRPAARPLHARGRPGRRHPRRALAPRGRRRHGGDGARRVPRPPPARPRRRSRTNPPRPRAPRTSKARRCSSAALAGRARRAAERQRSARSRRRAARARARTAPFARRLERRRRPATRGRWRIARRGSLPARCSSPGPRPRSSSTRARTFR